MNRTELFGLDVIFNASGNTIEAWGPAESSM